MHIPICFPDICAKMSLAKMSGDEISPSDSFNDLKTMFDSTKIVLMLFFFNAVCRKIHLESTKINSNKSFTFCACADWPLLGSTETRVLFNK